MAEIVTIDVTAHNGTTTTTLRFATQAYTTSATDSPAHSFYDGRVAQPGNMRRTAFDQGTTYGLSQIGYGEVVLVNVDGRLDQYLTYGFAGFGIVIKRGVKSPNQATPTWTTVLSGVMDSVDFSWSEVSIKIRDRQQELLNPLQAARYGGTNALPAGLDGVATDLQGKCKPILFGRARNVSPPCVNTTRQIYQLSDGVIQSVDAVYDRGTALTAGATYASQADMETNAPAASQYRAWLNAAGSFIRLGSAPAGTLTVDASQGAAVSNRTPAQLMSQVLQKAGIAAGDISSADITALDAVAAFECGLLTDFQSEQTGRRAMDALANSAGAFWGVDRLGKFRMKQLAAPSSGDSIGTLSAVDVLAIDRVRSGDSGGGVPAWQVKVLYSKVETVQKDLAATIAQTYKNERSEQYRKTVANDSAIKTQWPRAVELEFETVLLSATNAAAEATRRLNLYKVRRDTLSVRARLSNALAALIDIGSTVVLALPRFGMSAGKPFIVTGIRTDLRNNIFELTLWG
jgi:hypothetical protein